MSIYIKLIKDRPTAKIGEIFSASKKSAKFFIDKGYAIEVTENEAFTQWDKLKEANR